MKCPNCKKELIIPDVVFKNAEAYGGGIKIIGCKECGKNIKLIVSIHVSVSNPIVTPEDRSWPHV